MERRPGPARGRLRRVPGGPRPDVSDNIPIGDDCKVSLKAMQQISGTGIKRDVVREGDGPDRAARWYSVTEATGSAYDADETERLEAAYASDRVELAVGDRTIDLQRMQQADGGRRRGYNQRKAAAGVPLVLRGRQTDALR